MAEQLYLANLSQQAACNAVVDSIDAGTGAGVIEIRSGTQPTDPNATATGTLLATLTFSDPAFGSASTAGVASASAITADTSADASGTATWARVKTSGGTTVFDCNIDETGSTTGATITLDNTSIVASGSVSITSFTITMPDGT